MDTPRMNLNDQKGKQTLVETECYIISPMILDVDARARHSNTHLSSGNRKTG